jgi:hypothetical protein
MPTAAGPTGGRALRLSGKSGQSAFLVARTNASVSSEPITGNSKTSALPKKPSEALRQPGPSRHAEQHTALHLAPGRELSRLDRPGKSTEGTLSRCISATWLRVRGEQAGTRPPKARICQSGNGSGTNLRRAPNRSATAVLNLDRLQFHFSTAEQWIDGKNPEQSRYCR